jgi:hypothetical protein
MALSKQISRTLSGYDGELTATAYCRVDNLNGSKDLLHATVGFYIGEARTDRKVYDFTPALDGDNFIKQAYEHLKTLPEFAGAADV